MEACSDRARGAAVTRATLRFPGIPSLKLRLVL
jgi:hypothetical protein